MKLLDRSLQRELLWQLAERYPNPMLDIFEPDDLEGPVSVNLHYLEAHGLVELHRSKGVLDAVEYMLHKQRIRGEPMITGGATITAAGMDFIAEDGGLSAILGTVTVRLHADTIRDLIEARITESEAPPAEKRRMVDALKAMPEEGLKQLTTRLIDYGLSQGPSAWQALSNLLS